jgi:Fe-S-cluster containining protein
MNPSQLFRDYEFLVDKAESAFQKMETEHQARIQCRLHCADCCHAVFGLFIIEAAYLQMHFLELRPEVKEEALRRGKGADKDLEKLQELLKHFEDDLQMRHYTLAKERIRCPLLDDKDECVLYHRRPITCRVYGIPTKIQGKARVCAKAEFKSGEAYPVFDLDAVYRELFVLSEEFLRYDECDKPEKASLLISVSKAIRTPMEDLIHEDLTKPDELPPQE